MQNIFTRLLIIIYWLIEMNKFMQLTSAIAILAVFPLIVTSCTDGGKIKEYINNKGKSQSGAIPVEVMTAETTAGIHTAGYVGKVEPVKSVLITGSYPGTLVKLEVSQGDYVKKGQTIAVIDSRAVQSSRDMAHATLKQAEDGYERLSKVHKTGSVADVQMIEMETRLTKARASAEAADKAYEDCTVKAPFSGVIGEVYPSQGIELGISEPIAMLMDISEVKIVFPVPEGEVGKITPGDIAEVEVPALKGAGEPSFRGSVISKGIAASMLSHSYDCTMKPDNKVEGLLPGMVCKVYTANNTRTGIIIPAASVMIDENGRYVWIAENGKAAKRHVTVDGFSGQGVIVVSGLSDGDLIITRGIQKISTGMNVSYEEGR